jgi:hypothetical protein
MSRTRLNAVLLLGLVAAALPWVIVYECGDACLAVIDYISAKLFLIALVESLLLFGFFEYYVLFAPCSAIRSTRSCLRLCKFCTLGGAVVPGGLFLMGKAGVFHGLEFYANFEEAGWTSVTSVAICLLALFMFNRSYSFLRRPENRRWAERE